MSRTESAAMADYIIDPDKTELRAKDIRTGRLKPAPAFLTPWPWWLIPFGCDEYFETLA